MTARVEFRDGASFDARGRELRAAIALELARAPEVPLALPHLGVTLSAITVDRRGIELGFGLPDTVAVIRFERDGDLPRVAVRERRPDAARIRKTLALLADRLAKGTDAARWSRAWSLAVELRATPEGVELESMRQVVGGVSPPTGIVRTGFDCNQDCGLCWQGRDWGTIGTERLREWIEDLARGGVRRLIISGGEPTLDRALPDHIRFARGLGFEHVVLETNAILLAKEGRAQELADAGLSAAFVSLHSCDAEISDRITGAPGTHRRTIAGVRALLDAGVRVNLNAVMVTEALPTLPSLPGFIREAFDGRIGALMLSEPATPANPQARGDARAHPNEIREALVGALESAATHGVSLQGLTGPCGPVLCQLGERAPAFAAPKPERVSFRRHVDACGECRLKDGCFGPREDELRSFGEDWLRPFA